jgi:SAM-dependent methyltransferase
MNQGPLNEPVRTAPCLICGQTSARTVLSAPDFEYQCRPGEWTLVSCESCGHVFIHPLPTVEEVPALYPSWYYTVNPRSPIYMEGPVVEAKMQKDAEALRRSLQGRTVRSIVDIGGGNLTRLIKLKEVFSRGLPEPVKAVCLDFQFDAAVEEKARAAGIRCVTGNVETDLSALEPEGYDLVIMRQLIEHLRDPRAALQRVRSVLSRDGLLVIDTPNRGGWDYRLFRRRYWGGYHIPRHFHLFTTQSLARLLRECGYAIERQGCTPSIAFWIISFRNALGLNSIECGRSFWEFLSLKSLPVVGAFYVMDLLWSRLGGQTSNQYAWARKADSSDQRRVPTQPSSAPANVFGSDPSGVTIPWGNRETPTGS